MVDGARQGALWILMMMMTGCGGLPSERDREESAPRGLRLEGRIRVRVADAEVVVALGPVLGAGGEHELRIASTASGLAIAHGVRFADGRRTERVRRKWTREKMAAIAAEPTTPIEIVAAGGRIRARIGDAIAFESCIAHDLGPVDLRVVEQTGGASIDAIVVSELAPARARELAIAFGPWRQIVVIAHRGASRDAPENTMVAIEKAMRAGAPAVEFDVYESADGQIVLMHDETVVRTTDFRRVFGDEKDARVDKLTAAELEQLDAGSWKSSLYAAEPIPLLVRVLDRMRDRAVPVIEIKPANIGAAVAAVVAEAGAVAEVFVQSFEAQAIAEFRARLPSVPTGLLIDERVSEDGRERARSYIRAARDAGASAVVCHYQQVDPEYIDAMHRHAMTVWVYTADDRAVQEALIRMGVDGIITNVPAELLAALDAHVGSLARKGE